MGAARPRAQGQATTRTLHASCRASSTLPAGAPAATDLASTCRHAVLGHVSASARDCLHLAGVHLYDMLHLHASSTRKHTAGLHVCRADRYKRHTLMRL